MLMEDLSQLADRILDQIADAVIYASCSGEIVRWNAPLPHCSASPRRKRSVKGSI
jgi:hypothetical protein